MLSGPVPARALILCRRLSRILVAYGPDIHAYDAASGAPLGVSVEICEQDLSALAIDHAERTMFAGSYGGELVQLLLTASGNQIYRRLPSRHKSKEIASLQILSAWGTQKKSGTDGMLLEDPEVSRHGSLLLSLGSDGSVSVTSVHEGILLTSFTNESIMGEGITLCCGGTAPLVLIGVGGASDGKGMLTVHRLAESSHIRPHTPITKVTGGGERFTEITTLSLLPPHFGTGAFTASRRLCLVGDASCNLLLCDIGHSGKSPIPLHYWRHPSARTSWLGMTRKHLAVRDDAVMDKMNNNPLLRAVSDATLARKQAQEASAPAGPGDALRRSQTVAGSILKGGGAAGGAGGAGGGAGGRKVSISGPASAGQPAAPSSATPATPANPAAAPAAAPSASRRRSLNQIAAKKLTSEIDKEERAQKEDGKSPHESIEQRMRQARRRQRAMKIRSTCHLL